MRGRSVRRFAAAAAVPGTSGNRAPVTKRVKQFVNIVGYKTRDVLGLKRREDQIKLKFHLEEFGGRPWLGRR